MRLVLLLALLPASAAALPRMSLTAGSPCATCHVDPTGGGARNAIGWSAMDHVGAFTYDQLGLQAFHDVESNTWLDLVAVGFDARLQWARLGRPTLEVDEDGDESVVDPEYDFIPMQLQPYLSLFPTDWLTVYGSYAVGPSTFDGEVCDPVFPGQSCFFAAAQIEPGAGLPMVRAGMIQPSIGVRHDDHTMLIRGDAFNRREPIIPPNYGEYGGEVSYHPVAWLRGEAGVFAVQHLDESLNDPRDSADLWPVAYLGRVTFLPRIELGGAPPADEDPFAEDEFEDFDAEFEGAEPEPVELPLALNTWIGASAYGSGEFTLLNGFLGLGAAPGWAVFAEVSRSTRGDTWDTLNGMLAASWAIWDWLVVEGRTERAQTTRDEGEYVTWQHVAGLQIFPVPYLEVRPEYRVVHNDDYLLGQATVQIHLFY